MRTRLLAPLAPLAPLALAVAVALGGCGDDSESSGSPAEPTTEGSEAPRVTNPCEVVTEAEARRLLGFKVTEDRTPMEISPTTENCSFVADDDTRMASLDLQSSPDDGSYDDLARSLTMGTQLEAVDVEIEGAVEAVLVTDPRYFPIATVATVVDGILHVAIAGDDDRALAEQRAQDAMELLLAG